MIPFFAYGALLNKHSAALTLDRLPDDIIYHDAWLKDCALSFDTSGSVIVARHPIDVSFLNVASAPNKRVLGKIIMLSEVELDRVMIREKGYEIRDIPIETSLVGVSVAKTSVGFAVGGRLPVLREYVVKVLACGEDFSPHFNADLNSAVKSALVGKKIIDGEYQFLNKQQNNLCFR